MSLAELLARAAELLAGAPLLAGSAPDSQAAAARRLLRRLLARRLAVSEASLFAFPERCLSEKELEGLETDLARIRDGEPLAYLFGEAPFLDWDFKTDSRALAPRPETEMLAQRVREACATRPPRRLLDLCCGSGVLGLALAATFPECRVDLTDLSGPALELARENAVRLGLRNRVRFFQGDLFQALSGRRHGLSGKTGNRYLRKGKLAGALGAAIKDQRFAKRPAAAQRTTNLWRKVHSSYDWILANPPYVAESDQVQTAVLRHEPGLALWSGDDGQEHIKRILLEIENYLKPNGYAAFELGHRHHESLRSWLETHLRRSWRFADDGFGVPRFLLLGF